MVNIDFKEFLSQKRIRIPYKLIDRSLYTAGFFVFLAIPPAAATQFFEDGKIISLFVITSYILVIIGYFVIFFSITMIIKTIFHIVPVIYRMARASCWQEFWDRYICWRADNRVYACSDDLRLEYKRNFNIKYRRLVQRWGNTI